MQQVTAVFRNTFREAEGRSDKRWWTVILKDGDHVQHKHFEGQQVEGVDEAESRAREYAEAVA